MKNQSITAIIRGFVTVPYVAVSRGASYIFHRLWQGQPDRVIVALFSSGDVHVFPDDELLLP